MKSVVMCMLLGLVLFACVGTPVLPENELQKLTPQKILDYAAERYSLYDYDNAIYYYSMVDKLFLEDNAGNNEAKAWARYEIGFIRYVQGQYDEALKYFDKVFLIKTQNVSPQILANQIREKIHHSQKSAERTFGQ